MLVSQLFIFKIIYILFSCSYRNLCCGSKFNSPASSWTKSSDLEKSTVSVPLIADVLNFEVHKMLVDNIAQEIRAKLPCQRLVLKRNPGNSHCARSIHSYKVDALEIDLSQLTKVISVKSIADASQRDVSGGQISVPAAFKKNKKIANKLSAVVDVQAMASMENLVDFLLPHGLIPAVSPEFKGITVGGAIQGLAGESTSFKFGYFHVVVVGFEAILGDGRVVWCSETSNRELFRRLPGSFGSIAICTRAKLLCTSAEPYVLLTCRLHSSCEECVSFMGAVQDASLACANPCDSTDFMEGIGYAGTRFVSVRGRFCSAEEADGLRKGVCGNTSIGDRVTLRRCNRFGHRWFYNQVDAAARSASKTGNSSVTREFRMLYPTKDYLFRHDRGGYVINLLSEIMLCALVSLLKLVC